ncbi:hypothetical protein H8959_014807 [Pygathrix nigripes]
MACLLQLIFDVMNSSGVKYFGQVLGAQCHEDWSESMEGGAEKEKSLLRNLLKEERADPKELREAKGIRKHSSCAAVLGGSKKMEGAGRRDQAFGDSCSTMKCSHYEGQAETNTY